jgi:protocatechuate 3,4-dioxygenase beta subunit
MAPNRTTSLSLVAAVATIAVAWFLEPDEALRLARRARRPRVAKASLAGFDGFAPAAAATRTADEAGGGNGSGSVEGEGVAPAPPPAAVTPVDNAITGVVLDLEGTPVSGATVLFADLEACSRDDLYRELGHALRPDDFRAPACAATILGTTSDARGEFRFEVPDRNREWLVAAGERERGISSSIGVPARVAAEEEPPPRCQLELGPAIAVRGRVLDADGRSAPASARCFVTLDVNVQYRGFDATIPVREDATFETPLIPDSFLRLRAQSGDFAWESDYVAVRAEHGVVQEVTLQLAAPAPIRLEGRLLGPDGRPLTFDHPYLAGFTPWELRCEREPYTDRSFTVRLNEYGAPEIGTTWDEFSENAGYYWFADVDLSDGRWSVSFDAREASPSSVALVVRDRVVAAAPIKRPPVGGAPRDATVLAGPDLRVEADASTRPCEIGLKIRVLDVATRACFADPRLQIAICFLVGEQFTGAGADAPDPAKLTSTTSIPFAARLCRVVVECPGYMPGAFDLEVQRRAEPYEVTVPLERAVRAIRGVVVDGAGRPVQDATARLFDEVGDGWRRAEVGPATTSKDGRIGITGIGASRKRLAIAAPGFAAACVDLPEGAADLEPTVVLAPGATVRFTGPPDDVHSPASGALRVVASDGRVVLLDTIRDRQYLGWEYSWPRSLTLAPGAYEWSIEFADGTGDTGAFVAAEGTEIVVTPRAR